MKTFGIISIASLLSMSALACGGPPPAPVELTNARAELVRAKNGSANQVDPTDVHDAQVALDRAESAWRNDSDNPNAIDLAVIAQLKAQAAEAKASAIQAENQKTSTEQDQQRRQAAALQAATGQLQSTQNDLTRTQERLERERQERIKAEEQLKSARATLSQIAQVKDDDRGMVVTFQGETLFKTAKSDLLPGAMAKLDEVAGTLKGQDRKIHVVGHTDNVGGNGTYNQELSERRANAVRDYLVSKGIPRDLIDAEGKGPSMPVGDNNTIEGRSMNRRVEIIVKPKESSSSDSSSSPSPGPSPNNGPNGEMMK